MTVAEPLMPDLPKASPSIIVTQPVRSGQMIFADRGDLVIVGSVSSGAEVIAAGNIGCMMQIGAGTRTPVVHTVELLDWATGGPKPVALA